MTSKPFSRRDFLAATAATAAAVTLSRFSIAEEPAMNKPIRIMLNTSTIRGCKIDGKDFGVEKKIEIAAKAGFDCIEIWVNELNAYKKEGKSLKDLAKLIKDSGITVEDSMGFAAWIVNDDAARGKALDEAKRDMDMVAELGCPRIAAPPSGATNETLPAEKIADRYKALAELGEKAGVIPMAEVWGFSKTFTTLNETLQAAMASGHKKACVLPDVYHLYKGGSSFDDIKKLTNGNFHVLHINDYPDIPRARIADKDRIYPGDGVAPLTELFKNLKAMKYAGVVSLELFNPEYYKQDPMVVAKTGCEKVKAAMAKA
jgi:sugar phosphate isomerase/epimerase